MKTIYQAINESQSALDIYGQHINHLEKQHAELAKHSKTYQSDESKAQSWYG